MDKSLEIINEQQVLGKDFKIYGSVNEPLFLAKDVADWIDHTNSRMMLKSIDEDEKLCVNNPYALQGQQEQWFLTEDGVYEVLMQSRKPIAKQFKKEVKRILKQIRKTGGYIPTTLNATPLTDDQIMAQALIIAHKTIENRNLELVAAKQVINQKEAELVIANDKVQVLTPKAEYCDDVLKAENLITTTDIAKYDYGISAIALNKLLCNWGIQYKKGNRYFLYAKYDGLGYIGSKTANWTHTDGSPGASINMMWTQRGRKMIYNEMKNHGFSTIAEQAKTALDAATCAIQ